MDRKTEAQIAAARGHDPCPNCGSADVTWRGRRWHESLRHALIQVIEWPFRSFYTSSRRPDLNTLRGTTPQGLDAHRHWRLREAFDARVAAMKPRIWACRTCGQRGEAYPEYASILAEYEGDLVRFEGNLPYGGLPDQPITRGEAARNPLPTAEETMDDTLR